LHETVTGVAEHAHTRYHHQLQQERQLAAAKLNMPEGQSKEVAFKAETTQTTKIPKANLHPLAPTTQTHNLVAALKKLAQMNHVGPDKASAGPEQAQQVALQPGLSDQHPNVIGDESASDQTTYAISNESPAEDQSTVGNALAGQTQAQATFQRIVANSALQKEAKKAQAKQKATQSEAEGAAEKHEAKAMEPKAAEDKHAAKVAEQQHEAVGAEKAEQEESKRKAKLAKKPKQKKKKHALKPKAVASPVKEQHEKQQQKTLAHAAANVHTAKQEKPKKTEAQVVSQQKIEVAVAERATKGELKDFERKYPKLQMQKDSAKESTEKARRQAAGALREEKKGKREMAQKSKKRKAVAAQEMQAKRKRSKEHSEKLKLEKQRYETLSATVLRQEKQQKQDKDFFLEGRRYFREKEAKKGADSAKQFDSQTHEILELKSKNKILFELNNKAKKTQAGHSATRDAKTHPVIVESSRHPFLMSTSEHPHSAHVAEHDPDDDEAAKIDSQLQGGLKEFAKLSASEHPHVPSTPIAKHNDEDKEMAKIESQLQSGLKTFDKEKDLMKIVHPHVHSAPIAKHNHEDNEMAKIDSELQVGLKDFGKENKLMKKLDQQATKGKRAARLAELPSPESPEDEHSKRMENAMMRNFEDGAYGLATEQQAA